MSMLKEICVCFHAVWITYLTVQVFEKIHGFFIRRRLGILEFYSSHKVMFVVHQLGNSSAVTARATEKTLQFCMVMLNFDCVKCL